MVAFLVLAFLVLAEDDFGLFGLLGVLPMDWSAEESSSADLVDAVDVAAREAAPPRVRVDRRVAAVAAVLVVLLMGAFFGFRRQLKQKNARTPRGITLDVQGEKSYSNIRI